MPGAKIDWTPFLVLALLLALIAAQHWLLFAAVLLAWERLLQAWRLRGEGRPARQLRAWSGE